MGKWSTREEQMKSQVRNEIIVAMWEQMAHQRGLSLDERVRKFATLKGFIGIKSADSAKLDLAIRQGNFELFKTVFGKVSYEVLADIEKYEYLAIKPCDLTDPILSQEDIEDLKEYISEKGISASVAITNNGKSYFLTSPNITEDNPVFSIHSIGKVFTGILVIKMIQEGILPEETLNKPVRLDDEVLAKLPLEVQKRLATTTLKQLMLHESGLGDYLPGQAKAAEDALNKGENPPKLDSSRDLLSYADSTVVAAGQYHYSNLGILLVGFALEKAYNDHYKLQGSNRISIDKLILDFVKKELKMDVFETHMPPKGRFNKVDQRFADQTVRRDQDYIYHFVASRLGTPAGGYCTTATDLQKLGAWIFQQAHQYPEFKRLIEAHGGEFYRAGKGAVSHSGLHADSAHFYVSLRNGTTISVLSDQGGLTATNLLNIILKQTTWFKRLESRDAASPQQVQPTQKVKPVLHKYKASIEPFLSPSTKTPTTSDKDKTGAPKKKL